MKSKYVLLTTALLFSLANFAQKKEIRSAEKALDKGDAQGAAAILKDTEPLIASAEDSDKAQYYFIKGKVYSELANKNIDTDSSLSASAEAYMKLVETEKATGKSKYSTEAANAIITIKYKLINSAIADSKADKNNEGGKKLYEAYLLDKKDTLNLYYAASTYVNAKNYDKALELYEKLKTMNYSGKGISYLAINKLTNEEDLFTTDKERDRVVKIGTHEKPRTEVIPSKRGEVYKNMALILVQNGKTAEAKKAIADARKANPEDTSLILTEANLYLETKDFDTYKKLIEEVLVKNPNDADLVFNLGVISANAKNTADAEKYYKRAIEIDPKYTNAYINLAALKLENERPIIEEMNKLGTSKADMKRYDELKAKREDIFRSVIPELKRALEVNPKNEDVAKTLLNVYSALEMTAEKKALQATMK